MQQNDFSFSAIVDGMIEDVTEVSMPIELCLMNNIALAVSV